MAVFKLVLCSLAILTSFGCALLLWRGYQRRKLRLLMWSTICFFALTANNILLFADMIAFPDLDLRPFRAISALIGILFLLYGFIWDAE